MQIDPVILTSLAREFGRPLTLRALMLVQGGAVALEPLLYREGFVEIMGEIHDGGFPIEVILQFDEEDGEVFGEFCSIDGGQGCAHTLAVQIAMGAQDPVHIAPVPEWQRALGGLVGPTAEHQERGELALFVSVINPARTRDRWSYGRRVEPFLGIRPAARGARGKWIKGNVEWHGLSPRAAEPHVIELVDELAGLHDLKTARYSFATPEWIPVAGLSSRGLWQVLMELVDAGVEMVSAGKSQNPVTMSGAVARARVVVEDRDGRLQVGAELLVGEEVVDARTVHPIGDPAIAIAQVSQPSKPDEQITLIPLQAPVPAAMWQLLRAEERAVVDEEGRELFERDYLPGLRTLAPIESPGSTYLVPPEPQAVLELEVQAAGDSANTVHLTWAWAGRGRHRDRQREGEILARVSSAVGDHADLVGAPPSSADQPPDRTLSGTGAVLFLGEVLPALRGLEGVRVRESEGLPSHSLTEGGAIVSIAAEPGENDWFDLRVEVEVDGEAVPFAQVFVALAQGEPIFVLPDGRYFSLTGPEFDTLRAIIEEARTLSDRPVEQLRISRYQVDMWQELLELGIVHAQEQAWLSAARGLTDAMVLEQVPVPAGVHAELRHYQHSGFSWLHFLRAHGLGGILADDMGLGKTLQAIALMEAAREEDPAMPPFLVVAPTSVVGNWVAECERFAPGLKVVAIEATARRRGAALAEAVAGAHVVVTSYTLLRLEEEEYVALRWSGAIFDEAQMVKNHRSRGYRSARLVEAPFKLAITGTPMENNLQELWALSALVCPGLLGGEAQFAENYRHPIERDGDTQRLTRLQRRLRPFLLRRRKEEVATELPPKQEQVRELELHPKHRRLYELRLQRERQKILGLLDDMDANRFQVFRSLTLLRQLALDAELVEDGESPDGDAELGGDGGAPPSAKLEALTELLNEAAAEGHRVLVFSTFTRFLTKARDRAEASGIATAYLDGSTRSRQAEIDRFRGGDAPVFFVSLKAGGFGLNLTEADYVVLLDPWWNPAAEAQAVDRTHRIGQTRAVMVYRLVSAGTIEAKVLSLSARKAKLFADVLDGGAATGAGMLTADEIRGLVS